MTDIKRVLLCIGCDAYESLGKLSGAEEDAKNVYRLLRSSDFGNYPEATSRLLLSPTCADVDHALSELIPVNEETDTLTIFFAGHGGVAKGSYYLCLKDTVVGKFATSAYSLSRLFEIINEVSPSQCNIIIDACESGGLVSNLATLLKPELIGMANTSGISIFATSAAKEYSLDTPEGGVGTTQLLRVLNGEVIVQDSRPYLDLVEAGRAAADLIIGEARKLTNSMPPGTFTAQTPVVWGLNLFGQSRFSKNPAYDAEQRVSLHSMVSIPSRSQAGAAISEASGKLWTLLYDSAEDLTPLRIFNELNPIAKKLNSEQDVVRFLSGVAVPLAEKMADSVDSFAPIELNATFISLLIEWCGQSGLAEAQIEIFTSTLIEQLTAQLVDVCAEIDDFNNALAFEGLADFYYLPIRISKLLGWCGAGIFICKQSGQNSEKLANLMCELAQKILDIYEACVFVISDLQAPYILTFLLAALKGGHKEIGEQFFGLYVSQLIKDKANVARASLEPEVAYDFVKARAEGSLSCTSSMVSNPSEVLSVLLLMARYYELDDVVDPYLAEIDHTSMVAFLPNTHMDFAQRVIHNGRNHNFQVGHGVWTVKDFSKRWESACEPQLATDATLNIPAVVVGGICASFLFPDRTPWFLLQTFKEG